jgi:hypothetical protein
VKGFLALTAIFCIAFSAAVAEQTRRWNDQTHITIQETAQPGAVAEVVFANQNIHTELAEEFDLTLGDITVTVRFERDVDASASDRFTVTPPPGYLAIPESLVVPENGAGVIFLFEEAIG